MNERNKTKEQLIKELAELQRQNAELMKSDAERKRAEEIQASIYKISEAAHSAENLDELYRSIHEIISELMPAENFYIALYDSSSKTISFPYFVDEEEDNPGPQKIGTGLTEYVLRTGEPLLASPEVFNRLEKKGEVESVGPPSIDWLGVPLKAQDKTTGTLVVQSYTEGTRYGEEDKNILMFISDQIAMAIERKEAEEKIKASLKEKEVLLQEIHHRVKNNMQVISSMLNLQSTYIKDRKVLELFKSSQDRIQSMALVHEKLYQSEDLTRINFAQYIQSLTVHLFRSYRVDTNVVRLKTDMKDFFLEINKAIPCGLIITELASNALKHAFPKSRIRERGTEQRGEILISLRQDKNGGNKLIVRDNGVGLPEDFDFRKAKSFGLILVNMLVDQLDGSIAVRRKGGTSFEIKF